MRRIAIIAAVLAVLSTPAAAQRAPDFATLDRGDGYSKVGLDLAWISLDDPTNYDSALHLGVYGQFVSFSGLGAYLALPLSRSFGDGAEEGEADGGGALGDFDLGGLYVISGADLSFVFRLGVVVPTASEDPGDFGTNFWGQQFRLTDIAMVNPDAWYARLSFSPLIHLSSLYLRGDLGVDIPFAEDDYRADPIGRLNVGGGVDLGVAAVGLELATIFEADDDDEDLDDDDEDFYSTAAVTARFMGATLQPYLSLGMPLNEWLRERAPFFIAFGIQGVLN
jgi:hypothetical protein